MEKLSPLLRFNRVLLDFPFQHVEKLIADGEEFKGVGTKLKN